MWAGLLGCAIPAWIQEMTGLNHGNGRGRRGMSRLRRELVRIPARITRRAGEIQLRLPPGPQLLATGLPTLQGLPAPADNRIFLSRHQKKDDPRYGTSAHPARQPGRCHAMDPIFAEIFASPEISAQKAATRGFGSERQTTSSVLSVKIAVMRAP